MFNYIVCAIIGHKITKAGACPFTGKTYDVCDRCTRLFETNT